MRTSTNLGLSLPDLSDYINAKRDISDNLEIIDDAFTISDITSQLTLGEGITVISGGVYKIGKLVVVQLRVQSTGEIKAGTQIVTAGMPVPINNIVGSSPVGFHTNRLGLSPYLTTSQTTTGIAMLSLSTEIVSAGTAVYLNAVYICQ